MRKRQQIEQDLRWASSGSSLTIGGFAGCSATVLGGPVQPDGLGQHMRIRPVGFHPGCGMVFPIPDDLHRVDRIHLILGSD